MTEHLGHNLSHIRENTEWDQPLSTWLPVLLRHLVLSLSALTSKSSECFWIHHVTLVPTERLRRVPLLFVPIKLFQVSSQLPPAALSRNKQKTANFLKSPEVGVWPSLFSQISKLFCLSAEHWEGLQRDLAAPVMWFMMSPSRLWRTSVSLCASNYSKPVQRANRKQTKCHPLLPLFKDME